MRSNAIHRQLGLTALACCLATQAIPQQTEVRVVGNGAVQRHHVEGTLNLRTDGSVRSPSVFYCRDQQIMDGEEVGVLYLYINSGSARDCRWERLATDKVRIQGKGYQKFRFINRHGRKVVKAVSGHITIVITNNRAGNDMVRCLFEPNPNQTDAQYATRGVIFDRRLSSRTVDFR